ncbi:WD40 repeat protein [Deinococcus metalli]|uniref:WD40 repeat protein n=1 Tax=Deinococcus metalli TaxID=1141878 RepID=A0A7W8KFU2_9DEIO|nr:WD40 repeat domain-containing protein [Deinococcus metalli]MBB5376231.1 WD40 repeat protein [Deinococcus metalli]GHF39811.1 hypothetical protein GCM10017781_15510 [Deinococcus metalli]
MRLSPLLLALSLSLGGTAGALTLRTAGVYALPGADVNHARPLSGGRWAVSADNAVMVLGRDLKVGRAWHTLAGGVRFLAVSPQGTRVAAMTRSEWTVWDLDSGAALGHGQIYADHLGFDAAGNVLVMYRGALLRNTLASGPERFEALDVGEEWDDFVASPDGARAVLLGSGSAQLVDLGSGEVLAEAELADDADGLAATFSPDGQTVVVRTGNEAFLLTAGGDVTDIEHGSDFGTEDSAVYFTTADRFVYVGGRRGQTYDIASGKAVGQRFSVPSAGGAARGSDGTFLALGRGVARFDPTAHVENVRTQLVSSNAWLGAFLPDGKFYAGVDDFRPLRGGAPLNVGPLDDLYAFDAQAGRVWTLNGTTVRVTQAGRVRALATLDEDAEYETLNATPDGTVAVASGYYGLAVLDARTGKVTARVTSDELDMEDIHAAIPTPDGRAVLIVPHEGNVVRYDPRAGSQQTAFRLPSGAEANFLQVTPGGTVAVDYTDEDGEQRIGLIRPGAAAPYKTVSLPATVRGLRFSPDGKALAVLTGGEDAPLRVYDTATGALLASAGPFNNVSSLLAWAASGRQLLVGAGLLGKAGSVTVFDVLP